MISREIKIALLLAFVTASIVSAIAAGMYKAVLHWGKKPAELSEPVVLNLEAGTSLKNFSRDLEREGVVTSARFFEWWVRLFDDYSRFQAGSYRFEGAVMPSKIASIIRSGEVFIPTVLQVTIPEGFSSKQIFARLVSQGIGNEYEFNMLSTDLNFLKLMRIPSTSLEGYLFPATYPFSKLPTGREALSVMVATFWDRLPERYTERASDFGLSLNEAVIFASLIEAETRQEEERALVSEVIWRRLKSKGALGIDAAIIYGIKDYAGDLKRTHLSDKNNPYNTRVHPGLPPTPICSPSTNSLLAVLTPSNEGYFYYVVDADRPTYHHFSKTAKEHGEYVRKLVLANKQLKRLGTGNPASTPINPAK